MSGHIKEVTEAPSALSDSVLAGTELAPRPVRVEATGDARLRNMFGEHFDFVWRSLRRLGVPQADADDGAQQVFIVASRRLDQITLGRERAFLFGTAYRIAADSRRTHRRRRESLVDELAERADAVPLADELVDRHRARACLDRLLDSLPLELRAVFILLELERLSRTEAAEVLGIPVGTVASRMRKARDLFEQNLGEAERKGEVP